MTDDTYDDPIVAETRALRDSYAQQFDYDPHRIVEDVQAQQPEWEAMGFEFVTLAPKKDFTDTSLHQDPKPVEST